MKTFRNHLKDKLTPQQEFMRYSQRTRNIPGMWGNPKTKAFSDEDERIEYYNN
jgi:hypothetical protein